MKNKKNDPSEEYPWTEISGIEFRECVRTYPSRIITSYDKGIIITPRNDVPSPGPGEIQLKITIAESLTLFSPLKPGAFIFNPGIHKSGILCVVLTGSVIFDSKEFLSGRWILVPPLHPFTLLAGKTGALICYCHYGIDQGSHD